MTGGRTLKLTVAYDGTAYHGFQRQAKDLTIQQVLEEKLAKIFGHSVQVAGAGRTDAGVHALGQVISLQTTGRIPTDRIPMATVGLLPGDIAVVAAEEVSPDFHARRSAREKTYRYRLQSTPVVDPLTRNHTWQIRMPLATDVLQQCLDHVVGKHDFSAFQSAGSAIRNPVRTLFQADCSALGAHIDIHFRGDGFLYHMVRNLVGTAVAIAARGQNPLRMKEILDSRDRRNAGATAPPQGLYLVTVEYPEEYAEKVQPE